MEAIICTCSASRFNGILNLKRLKSNRKKDIRGVNFGNCKCKSNKGKKSYFLIVEKKLTKKENVERKNEEKYSKSYQRQLRKSEKKKLRREEYKLKDLFS